MRILMLAPYLPWPLYSGSAVRMFHMLKELSRRGHQIVLLAGGDADTPLPPDHILNRFCEKVLVYHRPWQSRLRASLRSVFSSRPYIVHWFQAEGLRQSVDRLLCNQSFDLIWVNFLILAEYLPDAKVGNTPVVLDQHECEEFVYKGYLQQGKLLERLFAFMNLLKLRRFEQQVLSRVSAVLCVSEDEAAFTRRLVPNRVQVWTVPNGVDTEFFHPASRSKDDANRTLLCGNMCVRRNIDAALWFVKRIFPKIRESIPDVEFWIVGSYPNSEIWKLNSVPGMHVTGTVDDIRDYYAKAKVFVAPYRLGAGTRLKILEAMASGIPIVSTAIGCQGIEVVDGRHVLIANNESEFSDRVIELLRNQNWRNLAMAGRALVEEKYRWGAIIGKLEPKLQELVSQSRR